MNEETAGCRTVLLELKINLTRKYLQVEISTLETGLNSENPLKLHRFKDSKKYFLILENIFLNVFHFYQSSFTKDSKKINERKSRACNLSTLKIRFKHKSLLV